jgi:2-oxoglutarate dehydrogenase E2 component (dihydrolipoamide succinyltransferase)
MIIDVNVPQLSESVAEATLVTWYKKAGEAVSRDENLIDIETDKVVLELPAPASGVLIEIIQQNGDTVTAGQLIARIDTEAEASVAATAAPARAEKAEKAAPAPAAPVAKHPEPAPAAGIAMPAARKILDEKGIAAADVSGTGRGGRVTKADAQAAVPRAAEQPTASPVQEKAPAPVAAAAASYSLPPAPSVSIALGDRPEQRVPMSRLRARVAERLVQSQSTNAILTTFNEVNMAPVMALRKQYGEKFEKTHGVRLGFMGFFVKAAVAALQ